MKNLRIHDVSLYLKQGQDLDLPLLTAGEERDLIERARGGSSRGAPPGAVAALHEVVLHNLPLAVHFAARRLGLGLELADLIQEANIGLIDAVAGFNLDYTVRFSTYATYHIRRRLTEAIPAAGCPIRMPRRAYRVALDWRRAEQRVVAALGAHPSPEMVAGLLGVSPQVARQVAGDRRIVDPNCWHRPGNEGEDLSLVDLLPDPCPTPAEAAELAEIEDRLHARLVELGGRQADVIVLRFGLFGHPRLTLKQIGSRWGVKSQRVGQIQDAALARLTRRPWPLTVTPKRRIQWPQIA